MMFHPMYQLVNAAFVGHMGETYLAALGLGSLTTGILIISIGSSFALVMGTLIAPAFGSGELRFCKVLLYRQMFLNTIVFAIIATPTFFIRDIYRYIGQDPNIIDLAAQYVWYVTPGAYFGMQAIAVADSAVSMKYTKARLIGNLCGSITHLLLIIVFVSQLEMGWRGICLATSLNFVARFTATWTYINSIKEFSSVTDVSIFSTETCTNLGF